ncbi:MAG: hypothetical protein ACE5Q6_21275 [Dehalococcoidia bacterium]
MTMVIRGRFIPAALATFILALGLLVTACSQTYIVPIPDQEIQPDFPYEYQARLSDDTPVLWVLDQAPRGMKISDESGRITWLEPPSEGGGSYQVTVKALGESETFTERFNIRLKYVPPTISPVPTSAPARVATATPVGLASPFPRKPLPLDPGGSPLSINRDANQIVLNVTTRVKVQQVSQEASYTNHLHFDNPEPEFLFDCRTPGAFADLGVMEPGALNFSMISHNTRFITGLAGENQAVSGSNYQHAKLHSVSPAQVRISWEDINGGGDKDHDDCIADVVAVLEEGAAINEQATTQPTATPALIPEPEQVPNLEATGISVGLWHTCAITAERSLRCWGLNNYGQLGDGTRTERARPVDVVGLDSEVVAVSAGANHTCSLTAEGGVQCWGRNSRNGFSVTPEKVESLTSGVVALASGDIHNCALTVEGGVKCWGGNSNGQLGDGTNTDRATPVDVTGLASGVVAISAGSRHTCALMMAGGVKCWGQNGDAGRLGDGSTTNRIEPVDVADLTSGVAAVAAGGFHTCALTQEGSVMCWGSNNVGQLGDGTRRNRFIPGEVTGLTSEVAGIAVGGGHSCALTTKGGIRCWGANDFGQVGDGTPEVHRPLPVDVVDLTDQMTAIALGARYTCSLTAAGGVKCWGENRIGQLGDGTLVNQSKPVDVIGFAGDRSAAP